MLVSQQNCNKVLLQELPFYEDDKIHHKTRKTYHAKTTRKRKSHSTKLNDDLPSNKRPFQKNDICICYRPSTKTLQEGRILQRIDTVQATTDSFYSVSFNDNKVEVVPFESFFYQNKKKKKRKKLPKKKKKWTNYTMNKLKFQAALYDSPFTDEPQEGTYEQIKTIMERNRRNIETRKQHKIPIIPGANEKAYLDATPSQRQKLDIFYRFEGRMFRLQHKFCPNCHRVRLSMRMVMGLCEACKKCVEKYGAANNILPTWKDEFGNVRYDIPQELRDLRIGEKLILQKASPLIPVVHIKNGTFGSRGHVCAFPQRIEELVDTLPRLPESCRGVKVLRTHKTKTGNVLSKAYYIRKQKVLDALRWLREYNNEYTDITIEEDNFEWMNHKDEAELSTLTTILTPEETQPEDNDRQVKCSIFLFILWNLMSQK